MSSELTYSEDQIVTDDVPIFHVDLAGGTYKQPFKTLTHMWNVTKVLGDLYLGKRTKPYRMNFYIYRWLSSCSNHNRKMLMELRTRGLIVGYDDA